MSHNCFVCLNTAKNKICNTCECYAHPACWGEYLKNSTDVLTYIYPSRVVVSTPFYARCPQCRGDIGNVKPTTRADTKFARRASLVTEFRNMIFDVEMVLTVEDRSAIFTKIFEIVVRNKELLKGERKFSEMLKRKLEYLYKNDEWQNANLYHQQIFGMQISVN